MFDPVTLLAGLLPVGVEAAKALIQRYLVPDQVKPATFDEFLQLQAQQLDMWKAMQGGDAPSYLWVAAVRQLQRPAVLVVVSALWAYQEAFSGGASGTVTNAASCLWFYLFGDRTLFYAKGKA